MHDQAGVQQRKMTRGEKRKQKKKGLTNGRKEGEKWDYPFHNKQKQNKKNSEGRRK